MAGLLDGVLPYLESQGVRLKNHVGGLLSDPMGSFEQTAQGLLDAHKMQQGLLGQAFANPQRPFQVTDQAAMAQAAQNMLSGPLGIAPVGMTVKSGAMAASKIDPTTGLPLNADGTVTVYHHTSKANADNILKERRIKSAGEPHVYFTTEKATNTGYGDTAVPVNVNPKRLALDDEFPTGRLDFSIDVKKPGGFFSF